MMWKKSIEIPKKVGSEGKKIQKRFAFCIADSLGLRFDDAPSLYQPAQRPRRIGRACGGQGDGSSARFRLNMAQIQLGGGLPVGVYGLDIGMGKDLLQIICNCPLDRLIG